MSAPAPGTAWQQQQLVSSYLDRRQILLPLIDLQEELIGTLLGRYERPIRGVLDLGCGDGAMTELVLRHAPGASAVLVDSSQPMLDRVADRLDQTAPGRWQAFRGDLSAAGWQAGIPHEPYDLVVSGMAIHHLTTARKRALFGEIFELLAPGGMFLNMDYLAIEGPLTGLFDEVMYAKAAAHGGHDHHHEGEDPMVDDLDSDEDKPDSLLDQLAWLGHAGFEQIEVHFKWAEAAVFGGVRPS